MAASLMTRTGLPKAFSKLNRVHPLPRFFGSVRMRPFLTGAGKPTETTSYFQSSSLPSSMARTFPEMQLCLRSGRALGRLQPHITAIGLQLARFHLVIEETRQNIVHHFFAQCGRIDGKSNLDPAIEITRHPIRAGEINLGLT